MKPTIRVKCPSCGDVNNVSVETDICPKCKQPMGLSGEGSIYIYRQGSFYGAGGAFGLYLNGQPYGYIGNRELLRLPLKFGTYILHSAVGMSRGCRDLQVTITPEQPVAYTKVYIKPGFWTNSFVIEPMDPALLELGKE